MLVPLSLPDNLKGRTRGMKYKQLENQIIDLIQIVD